MIVWSLGLCYSDLWSLRRFGGIFEVGKVRSAVIVSLVKELDFAEPEYSPRFTLQKLWLKAQALGWSVWGRTDNFG